MTADTYVSTPTMPARISSRSMAKANTRRKIIASARSLFLSVGYEETTIRNIAQNACISTGAVFASFEGKAPLLLAVLEEVFAEHLAYMEEVVGKNLPLAATLTEMFSHGYRNMPGEYGLMKCLFAVQAVRGIPVASFERYEHRTRWLAEQVLARCRLHDDPNAGPAFIAAMLWGLYLDNFRYVEDGLNHDRLRSRMSRQVEIVIRGIKTA